MKKIKALFAILIIFMTLHSLALAAGDKQGESQNLKELILLDARSQGIDKMPEIQAAIRAAQDAVLIAAWEKGIITSQPISQEMKDSVYKEMADLLGNAEYRIFHVFVTNETAAKKLITQMEPVAAPQWDKLDLKTALGPDAKFKAAKTDWINISAVLPEFRSQVKATKPGKVVAQPIPVKDGWQVVGLLETRPFKLPPPEKIDQEVTKWAERKIVGQKIQSLMTKK